MFDVSQILVDATIVGGLVASVIYVVVRSVAALVSVFAPTAEQRRDARSTLTILVRKR